MNGQCQGGCRCSARSLEAYFSEKRVDDVEEANRQTRGCTSARAFGKIKINVVCSRSFSLLSRAGCYCLLCSCRYYCYWCCWFARFTTIAHALVHRGLSYRHSCFSSPAPRCVLLSLVSSSARPRSSRFDRLDVAATVRRWSLLLCSTTKTRVQHAKRIQDNTISLEYLTR